MRKKTLLLLLFAVCVVCGTPQMGSSHEEDGEEKKPFFLSPSASWFFPTSGKVKDAFGDSWGGLGVGINPEAFGWKESEWKIGNARLSPYFGYFNADKGDNEAHIIPIGIEALWTLKEWDNVKTYLGIGLAGYGVKFKDRAAGIDTDWKLAGGGRIMLQADVSHWLTLQASYNAISDVEGYNFGGFFIGAEIKLYF